MGGDFYDFFLITEKKLGFLIADVSGKGVPAALFMVITKTLIRNEAQKGDSPHEILSRVNKLLYPDNDTCMFVTTLFAILNADTGEVEFANAGHNPPLIYRKSQGFEFVKVDGGFVLGPMPTVKLTTSRIQLNRNDIMFLYTDGVTEAMNPEGKLFSENRLKQLLSQSKPDSLKGLIQYVRKEIANYAQTAPQSDDITLFALEYLKQ
ncbi:MAG TPA: hypothetical protein DHV62_05910 [Elusimicrobia bacterium]|nr:hypothetical protein [Elusimicrobiota bacterium]